MKKPFTLSGIIACCLIVLLVVGCKKDKPSYTTDIISFEFKRADNPSLPSDIQAAISNDTISFQLPSDTTSKNLVPLVTTSVDATVTPSSLQRQDFTNPVTYRVTAPDGSSKSYVAIIRASAKLKDLKINGARCAYSANTNTFYYPVSPGNALNGYTVSFDTTLARAVVFDNVKAANGGTVNYSLTTNKQLTIQAIDRYNTPVNYNLIITGLPIVELTTMQTIGDDEIKADFNLVDPDYQSRKTQLQVSSGITINIRGASSRAYPKKSYAVHTTNSRGDDADISLLGLREDNSWILDAMYIDQSRMRNRLCTDIWNSFNNVPYIASEPKALNGTRGFMTEVFLNNQYWGVYCLTEKLDRKQLQIKKSYGKMYKANERGQEVDLKGVSPYNNSSDTWGGWELEYPGIGDTPAPEWGYLYNFVNYVSNTSKEDFLSQVTNKLDVNNMVDYYILMNILSAQDNETKNTFLSFYDYRNAGQFFYSVWDLDSTLGRLWDGSKSSNFLMGPGDNNLLDRLVSWNANNFRQKLKDRWNSIKGNQLSKTTINSRIENYRKQLEDTKAYDRERATWNNLVQDLNVETTYMKNWYSAQYDHMDNYINGL